MSTEAGQEFHVVSLDVPDGDATLAVTAAGEQGLLVWDVTDKGHPTVHYQDTTVLAPQGAAERMPVAQLAAAHEAAWPAWNAPINGGRARRGAPEWAQHRRPLWQENRRPAGRT